MESKEPRFMESSIPDEELDIKKVNLDAKKSRFVKQKNTKEAFEQMARQTNEKMQGHLAEAFELGKQYRELLEDQTISENKNFLIESKEKEIVGKLVSYAIKVNADHNENEGMGSVAIVTLLLKCVLRMRDRYNDVAYKCHILEKNYTRLEEKFNLLSSRVKPDESK
jgi:hypothetical protein